MVAATGSSFFAGASMSDTFTGLRNGIMSRKPFAHGLDQMLALLFALGDEVVPPSLVLLDPLGRELAVADLFENLLHLFAGFVGDQALSGGVVAVLGGVADRVAHVAQSAAIHQVDDQLQFMQALEVGDLGLIAGIDQRLESGLHQSAGAAAQARPARRTNRSRSLR